MKTEIRDDFDLAVCYRIYPGVSANPILGFKDKLALVQLNLETFKEAIGDLKVKMWVLLDNCPPAYQELVAALFPGMPMEIIKLNGEGNWATFVRQIGILGGQRDADLVYFAEDDYLYLPRSLELAVAFLKRHPEADALTLADHSDYHRRYVDRIRSRRHMEDGRCWRTVVATAMSFMIRREVLIETGDVFKTYGRGNSDLGLWMALTKLRVFNPWCCVRGFGDGIFIPGSQALAWWHAWRYILFGRRRTLWAPTANPCHPHGKSKCRVGGGLGAGFRRARAGVAGKVLQETGGSLDNPRFELVSEPPPELLARSQRTPVHRQWRQRGAQLEGRQFFHLRQARGIVVNHHPVEMFNRGPAAPFFRVSALQVGAIIVLAGQNPQAVEVSGLNDFVEAELIIGNGAEMGAPAGDDFRANVAAARHVPEEHAAVEKTRRVTLPEQVAAALVFDAGGHVRIAEQLFKRRQGLKTKHVKTVHRQRAVHAQVIEHLHAPVINLAQRV